LLPPSPGRLRGQTRNDRDRSLQHDAVDLHDREADDDDRHKSREREDGAGIAAYGEILKLTETSLVDHQE
jgi:hypothetical protein